MKIGMAIYNAINITLERIQIKASHVQQLHLSNISGSLSHRQERMVGLVSAGQKSNVPTTTNAS